MLRLKQKFSKGLQVVHFVSTIEIDRALCGQDLAGDNIDDRGEYKAAEETQDKVDCIDCIRIIKHCKSIKRGEYI
jgi:hypothetical protein